MWSTVRWVGIRHRCRWVHGGGVGVDLPLGAVFAFSTLPFGDWVALFEDPFPQFGVVSEFFEEGSVEIFHCGLLLGISFRTSLISLESGCRKVSSGVRPGLGGFVEFAHPAWPSSRI